MSADRTTRNTEGIAAMAVARPFVRSIVAFILHLRFGNDTVCKIPDPNGIVGDFNIGVREGIDVRESYDRADHFLRVLDADLDKPIPVIED